MFGHGTPGIPKQELIFLKLVFTERLDLAFHVLVLQRGARACHGALALCRSPGCNKRPLSSTAVAETFCIFAELLRPTLALSL